MLQRRKVIIGAIGAAAGLTAAAGCSDASKSAADGKTPLDPVAGSWGGGSSASASPSVTPVQLTVSPDAGKTGVSPAETVTVAAQGGKLATVTLVSGTSKVNGEVQADGIWQSTGALAYGKTYKVTASITDTTGATVSKTSSFTTVKPASTAKVSFQANGLASLETGGTYGMGQPVIVAFSKTVHDRDAAEKAIQITTTPSVEGKFYWFNDSTVHWRPEKYWAKGTKVEVTVNALGANLGKGVYGAANRSTNFTIGRQLLAVSDNSGHHTKVYIDGALVRTMASSNGRGGYTKTATGQQIHFWTQNGPHVVLSKELNHSMSSASYGVSNPSDPFYYAPEMVHYCTRITYSGEFLHAAPWNHVLGRANISHGCINLSITDAEWVYHNFMIGDVVDVQHSPKPLPIWDGLGDWTVSYDKYGS